MTAPRPDHPAKFSAAVLDVLQRIVDADPGIVPRVLDPFAGVGRIHDLRRCETTGVELEPEWAACRRGTIVGDATKLDFPDASFDLVMTSPCYGNRMADHHVARDRHRACDGRGCDACGDSGYSPRKNYRAALGRMPSAGSAAVLHWSSGPSGNPYRELHVAAILEMERVLVPGGLAVVNMSNHIRGGRVQPVIEWWVSALAAGGLPLERVSPVVTPRMGYGQNYAARTGYEVIIECRKP